MPFVAAHQAFRLGQGVTIAFFFFFLAWRGYKWQKVMLLLPRIDLAYQQGNPEVLTKLDALIETTSERQNVLVAATTVAFEANSDLDNIFGIKLLLPAAKVARRIARRYPKTPRARCSPK